MAHMTPQQVIEHWGTQTEVAVKLGCKQPTVSGWVKQGYVPKGIQAQIQLLTGGKLVADVPRRKKS